ncbi:MAG: shikimate kinase [Actinomycetota bacterium]|nr:shikimate kinase [Actinomycetota bacterium]
MSPRVVLVGLPGAGKSTTGRRLAKILVLPFADSDDLVEAATGRRVREIFAESGEPAFRSAEGAAIRAAMSDFDGVLSLGGGALTVRETRDAVASSGVPVVLLEAPVPTLTARVGDGASRPLLADDPARQLALLAEQRRPAYIALATLRVDTTHRTPGQVASLIAARLHDWSVR